MAVDSKDIPITREQAQGWLDEYDKTHRNDSQLEAFLTTKVDELELTDTMVDTTHRDDYAENEVHVVQMILDDLPSYARIQNKPA